MPNGTQGDRFFVEGDRAGGGPSPLDGQLSITALRALHAAENLQSIDHSASTQAAPFVGHGILTIKSGGRVRLPEFVCRTMTARRSHLFLGLHEVDACLVGFTQSWHERVTGELCRRHSERLQGKIGDDRSYARRVFGFCEQIWHSCGTIRLPEWAMATAGISDTALIVGAGETFEIWSPEEAEATPDKTLVALARSAAKFNS